MLKRLSANPLSRKPAKPISRALNLKAAGIFRLLVVTTALLGGVIALGGASAAMLQGLYSSWHLQHTNSLTVYLPPEAEPAAVTQLTQSLSTLQGVQATTLMAPQVVQGWLQGVPQAENLPLPTVLTVALQPNAATEPLTAHIKDAFPVAEVDDHKPLLQQVSGAVRTLQLAMLGLGTIMLALMALLIVLTTRTGLQAQAATLHLLVQLGATDTLLIRSIGTQVLARTLAGYALGTAAAAVMLALAAAALPSLAGHVTAPVIAVLLLSPLLLPLMAITAAAITARHLLHKLT